MKKITLLLSCMLYSLVNFAQLPTVENTRISTAEVPEIVRASQETNYPTGFVKSWSVDRGLTAGDDEPVRYQAIFSTSGETNSNFATYLPNGMLFYTSQFLQPNLIPSKIIIKTRSEYDAYEIEHADLITLYEPKREVYRLKIRDQARVKMVYYTMDGMPIPRKNLPEELLVFKY